MVIFTMKNYEISLKIIQTFYLNLLVYAKIYLLTAKNQIFIKEVTHAMRQKATIKSHNTFILSKKRFPINIPLKSTKL